MSSYCIYPNHKITNKQKKLLDTWNSMSPKDRDYDRMVGSIPYGALWRYETKEAQEEADKAYDNREDEEAEGCSCHINPPCSYCENGGE